MLRIVLVVGLLLPISVLAQGDERVATVQFTGQSTIHDVRSTAMGTAGAFLPDASPLAFIENPARLAEGGVVPMLRVTGSGHPDYVGFGGISTAHLAASHAVGPAVLGAVVSNQSFGTLATTDESGNVSSEDEFGDAALALAAAMRFGTPRAHLDVGVTGRLSQVRNGSTLDVDGTSTRSRSTKPSMDVGVIGSFDAVPARPLAVGASAPTVTISAGYVQRYIGPSFEDEFYGLGETSPTTIELRQPRDASLGYSAQLGLDTRVGGGRLRVLSLDLAVEAEAELASRGRDGDAGSVFIGPMRLQDAVLGTSGSSSVTGQRGVRLTVGDALWAGLGQFDRGDERSGDERTAWGMGLSAGGALRTIGTLQDRPDLVEAGRRFDVTVGYARLSGINGFAGFRLGSLGVSARL